MVNNKIATGTVHSLPEDLQKAIVSNPTALTLWADITPLARNEFICWISDAKKDETRKRRIERACEELVEGKRRPCCWIGCIHRNDKQVSPAVKAILDKRTIKNKI